MMNRFVKYLAGLALVLILLFLTSLAVTLIFRKGDPFHPASRVRAAIWLSKRIVAETTALPVSIWDPYKESHRFASTGPPVHSEQMSSGSSFSNPEFLQDFFNTSADLQEAVVKRFINGSLPGARFDFYYQPANEQLLDSLANLYNLKELKDGEADDYAVLTKTMCWLHDEFHGVSGRREESLPEVDFNFNALDILYRVAHGERFWCSEFSTTFVQCLAAIGYTARYVMLNSQTGGHVLCEAWCETYGKWIMLDPYFNRIVTLGNEPLDVYEIHRLLAEPERHQRAVILQNGHILADQGEKEFYLSLFRNFAVRMRNDWFTNRYPHWYPLSNSVMNALEWQDELTYDNIYYKHETNRLEDLYWPLNRVRMAVQPGGDAQLNLFLETFTPNFSHFLVRYNNGHGISIQNGFYQWKLHPGLNGLEIASVNQWGIRGRPVSLEIEWHPQGQM